MTRDDAIKLILLRCGMRQNDTVLQEACVVEMQLAQQTRLERASFKPWFLLTENETTITLADEERIPLPKDFLLEYEEGALWIRDYDELRDGLPGYTPPPYRQLVKRDQDESESRYGYVGTPRIYSIVGNYFTLHPVPDRSFMLKMKYYAAEPLILEPYGQPGAVTSNAWLTLAADWLIGETGAVIAGQYIKDDVTAAKFQAQADGARSALLIEHTAREEANHSRQMGDD